MRKSQSESEGQTLILIDRIWSGRTHTRLEEATHLGLQQVSVRCFNLNLAAFIFLSPFSRSSVGNTVQFISPTQNCPKDHLNFISYIS